MKVLLINSVCGIRSTGRICTEIASKYINQGHTVKIAYGRCSVPNEYQEMAVRIGNGFQVILNALKCRVFDNDCFASKAQTRRFLKWADEYNPDLLWLHNLHGYYINIELLFEWIKSRPNMKVKWTFHDGWSLTGHCSFFNNQACDQWQEGCYNCKNKKEYPASYVFSNAKYNYTRKKKAFCGVKDLTIITPSQWLADIVKKSYLKNEKIEVIHNSIDLNIFRKVKTDFKAKYKLEDKKIVLGVAAIWNDRKGIDDFVRLSSMLDPNYKIVLVGLNRKQLKSLPKTILGLERTDNAQELAELYSAADVFFNPTYQDNYPTVNLEAQACGTKVVTYDTGGSAETIYTENSVVVKKGDLLTAMKHF